MSEPFPQMIAFLLYIILLFPFYYIFIQFRIVIGDDINYNFIFKLLYTLAMIVDIFIVIVNIVLILYGLVMNP